jgi:hypothetical protein
MKNYLTLLFLFLISAFSFAQTIGSEKVLVKTMDTEGASQIVFDFRHKEINSEKWDRQSIRLQLEIYANMPESILAQLVKAGRYNLEGHKEGDFFYITAPNLEKSVTIGGKQLEEQIVVNVQMPDYLELLGDKISVSPDKIASGHASIINISVDMNIEYRFVYKEATVTAPAASAAPISKSSDTVKAPKTEASVAPSTERQAHFGEILIDGVKLEVE